MAGSDDDISKKTKQTVKLPARAAKTALLSSALALSTRAGGSFDDHLQHRQPWHSMPRTVAAICVACVVCVAATCFVALFKVVTGSDTAFAAYGLAGTCVIVCGILLAAFFGKSSKAGPMSTTK